LPIDICSSTPLSILDVSYIFNEKNDSIIYKIES